MPAPLGYYRHRNDPGLRGMLTRWWEEYRRRQVRRAKRKREEA